MRRTCELSQATGFMFAQFCVVAAAMEDSGIAGEVDEAIIETPLKCSRLLQAAAAVEATTLVLERTTARHDPARIILNP